MQKDFDPRLDLAFERKSKLSIESIWKGWTDPETLMKWFCPRPWKVTECRIDPRPGGEFYTLMKGPQGESMPGHGCFLEVVPLQKLVWTNSLSAGFRPAIVDAMGFAFTGTILLSKSEGVTLYRAVVKHANMEGQKQHAAMGFQEGWGMAFQQLEELV